MESTSFRDYLKLTLLSLSLILIGLFRQQWELPPISGMSQTLNAQVGYITGARSLVDRGVIETSIIYPSTLLQPSTKQVFYGPGHYWFLALPIWVFGAHDITYMLSSAVCYLLSIFLVFSCAQKIYGKEVGYTAALLFSVFPTIPVYSLSAMAEMSVVFTTILSFWLILVFRNIRFKWVLIWTPLIPVFFRETSILVIFPMAGILFFEDIRRKKVGSSIMFLLFCSFLWILAILMPLGGRPSLLKANIFGGFSEQYLDALFYRDFNPSSLQWLETILLRLFRNLIFLFGDTTLSLENYILKLFGVFAVLCCFSGIKKKDGFRIGAGIMALLMLISLCGFYALDGFRGLRCSLILLLFFCILVGYMVVSYFPSRTLTIRVFICLCGLVSYWQLTRDFSWSRYSDKQKIMFVDSVHSTSQKLLVAPFSLALPWVPRNYPNRWSFVPYNLESLRFLDKKEEIGTLILNQSELTRLKKDKILEMGFHLTGMKSFRLEKLIIFKKAG